MTDVYSWLEYSTVAGRAVIFLTQAGKALTGEAPVQTL